MFEIVTAIVVASSSSGDGGGELALLAAGPLAGSSLYWWIYRRYRNTDKSHQYERDTLVERKSDVTGDDRLVDKVRGTRRRGIQGANQSTHRQRVARIQQ